MGLLGAVLLVASANAGWVVRHILSNPVTRFVSAVSMQFYIWHQTLAVWLLRARIIPSVSATPELRRRAALAEAVYLRVLRRIAGGGGAADVWL